jgi:hypothetical protein
LEESTVENGGENEAKISTLRVPKDVLKLARRLAGWDGKTLASWANTGLREILQRECNDRISRESEQRVTGNPVA